MIGIFHCSYFLVFFVFFTVPMLPIDIKTMNNKPTTTKFYGLTCTLCSKKQASPLVYIVEAFPNCENTIGAKTFVKIRIAAPQFVKICCFVVINLLKIPEKRTLFYHGPRKNRHLRSSYSTVLLLVLLKWLRSTGNYRVDTKIGLINWSVKWRF